MALKSLYVCAIIYAIFPHLAVSTATSEAGNDFITAIYYSSWSYPNQAPSDIPLSRITHIFYAFAGMNQHTKNIAFEKAGVELHQGIPFETDALRNDINDLTSLCNSDDVDSIQYRDLPWVGSYLQNSAQFLLDFHINASGIVGQLGQIRQLNPRLKVSLSIGGDGAFKEWKKMASKISYIEQFVGNVVANIEKFNFDGVDIDWEFPSTKRESIMLTNVVKYFRFYLEKKYPREHKILTVAIPMDVQSLTLFQFQKIDKYVDFYNLMGYDASGKWSRVSGYHSPLYPDSEIPGSSLSVDTAVQFLSNYINSSKIILGMPAYGVSFNTDKMYDKFTDCAKIRLSHTTNDVDESSTDNYNDYTNDCIVDYVNLPPPGYVEVEDLRIGSSYAYSTVKERKGIIVYDTPNIARVKANYVVRNGLGGGMWWDSKGDPLTKNTSRSLVYNFIDELGGILKLTSNITMFSELRPQFRGGIVSQPVTDQDFQISHASPNFSVYNIGRIIWLCLFYCTFFS